VTTGWYVAEALQGLGHNVVPLDIHQEIEPPLDLVIKVDDTFPLQEQHASLKNFPNRVFWMLDSHTGMQRCLAIARLFPIVVCAQKEALPTVARNVRARLLWLPYAASESIGRDDGVERDIDIAFVGRLSPPRVAALDLLGRYFRVAADDSGNPSVIPTMYSRSKMVVNFPLASDLNMRVFEAMACGALLLQHTDERLRIDNGMDELMKPGIHYAEFSCLKDAIQKAQYFVGHKSALKEVAERGQRVVREHHMYADRMQKLLQFVSEGDQDAAESDAVGK